MVRFPNEIIREKGFCLPFVFYLSLFSSSMCAGKYRSADIYFRRRGKRDVGRSFLDVDEGKEQYLPPSLPSRGEFRPRPHCQKEKIFDVKHPRVRIHPYRNSKNKIQIKLPTRLTSMFFYVLKSGFIKYLIFCVDFSRSWEICGLLLEGAAPPPPFT